MSAHVHHSFRYALYQCSIVRGHVDDDAHVKYVLSQLLVYPRIAAALHGCRIIVASQCHALAALFNAGVVVRVSTALLSCGRLFFTLFSVSLRPSWMTHFLFAIRLLSIRIRTVAARDFFRVVPVSPSRFDVLGAVFACSIVVLIGGARFCVVALILSKYLGVKIGHAWT